MPGVRIYLQNIDHFYTMHSYTRILYLEEVGRRGAYLAPGLSEKTENFTFILTFLAKKFLKGGIVQALYGVGRVGDNKLEVSFISILSTITLCQELYL